MQGCISIQYMSIKETLCISRPFLKSENKMKNNYLTFLTMHGVKLRSRSNSKENKWRLELVINHCVNITYVIARQKG